MRFKIGKVYKYGSRYPWPLYSELTFDNNRNEYISCLMYSDEFLILEIKEYNNTEDRWGLNASNKIKILLLNNNKKFCLDLVENSICYSRSTEVC
jgi:hypothetical protein